MTTKVPKRFVPFAYGFRPFFLLAGLYAVIAIAAWLWMFGQGATPLVGLAPQAWHGHEMIFGFIAAAIAGFLLTAVPSWTGRRGFADKPLVFLTLLWLAGRLAFMAADLLPSGVISLAELAFLPALMLTIGSSLVRTINRNTPLLLVLFIFWIADAVFMYGVSKSDGALTSGALRGALGFVLVLVTVIGGRIVPAFTRNALTATGVNVKMRSHAVIEYTVIPVMVVYAISDIIDPFGTLTAIVATLAGLLQLARLSGWRGVRTGAQPIVWVLHLAYLWLPVGMILKVVYIGTGLGWAAHWQHALGAGAAATMIMAVMTRASLGHTGRPLKVPASITMAYVLLTLSVVLRVFGPAALPIAYQSTIVAAGIVWALSFGVFIAVYTPILIGPRIDGKPN